MKRISSKKSNIYKIIISDSKIFDIAYTTSVIKIERYVEEWAESIFTKENYQIIMSRLNIQDDEKTWGTLIDTGTLHIIDSDVFFDVKIYRLNVI